MKPRLLDLFCGAGGAAMGYHRAGFEVVGVDIKLQPHYPFEFHQGDAMEIGELLVSAGSLMAREQVGSRLGGRPFSAIHASPPCQAYSTLRVMPNARTHPDLVSATRALLRSSGLPSVIENVPGAPLLDPITLCGTMFGLTSNGAQLRRHRLFEVWPGLPLTLLPPHAHQGTTLGVYGAKVRNIALEKRHYAQPKATRGAPVGVVLPHGRAFEAMGIDWMTIEEASLAIPPAYTEWIGTQLLASMERAA